MKIIAGLLAFAVLHFPANAVAADPAAPETEYIEYEANLAEKGSPDRKLTFVVHIKINAVLVEMTSPPDIKGVRFLITPKYEKYAALPEYGNRVRRLGDTASAQGILGMTFSLDDIDERYEEYESGYKSGPSGATVVMTPKPGRQALFTRLEVSGTGEQVTIKFFDARGGHIKTETRSERTCLGPICAFKKRKMVDHTKNDQTTVLTRTAWKVNEPMLDSQFTKQALK